MAVLTLTDSLTALERVHRSNENADARRIIECLKETNEILLDAPIAEANERTSNRTVQRTMLPTVEHRVYNQGVRNSASKTKTIHDVICELAAYSDVDMKLVREAANPEEFLSTENASFIEAMGETQSQDFIYGSSVSGDNMDGFAVRRDTLDGRHCIGMGGSDASSNTSIYIVKWGMDKAHLIYPKGAAGLGCERKDLGEVTAEMGDGRKMQVYRNYYSSSYGFTLRNEKALVRLANINPTSTSGSDIVKAILKAFHFLPSGEGTIAIYGNNDVLSLLDAATVDKSNVVYTAEDPWGNDLLKIRNARLRQVDSILTTEAVVS